MDAQASASASAPPSFTELNDLSCEDIGGRVIFATDDWFAPAENLLKSEDPVWKEGFTECGKWMDGWESRRKRTPGHDWCIIRLGNWPQGGQIHGFSLNTGYFTGNYPPRASIQAAARLPTDDGKQVEEEFRRLKQPPPTAASTASMVAHQAPSPPQPLPASSTTSMMGTCASPQHMEAVDKIYKSDEWETLVPMTELQPGYDATRLHFFPVKDTNKTYTHVRLNIYPDGGIGRLRTYGIMQPPPIERLLGLGGSLVDLVAMENGGVCLGLSDAHYGHPRNLIKKNRGIDMGDGWETARRKDRPAVLKVDSKTGVLDFADGKEWCVLKLGVPGVVKKIEVDTNHFKGNFPDSIVVEARSSESSGNDYNIVLLAPTKLGPHQIHNFDVADAKANMATISHVKVTIQPDGGLSRIRLFGHAKHA